jgi:hypothetical protein
MEPTALCFSGRKHLLEVFQHGYFKIYMYNTWLKREAPFWAKTANEVEKFVYFASDFDDILCQIYDTPVNMWFVNILNIQIGMWVHWRQIYYCLPYLF